MSKHSKHQKSAIKFAKAQLVWARERDAEIDAELSAAEEAHAAASVRLGDARDATKGRRWTLWAEGMLEDARLPPSQRIE